MEVEAKNPGICMSLRERKLLKGWNSLGYHLSILQLFFGDGNGREKKLEQKPGSDQDSRNHHCADNSYQRLIRDKVSFLFP